MNRKIKKEKEREKGKHIQFAPNNTSCHSFRKDGQVPIDYIVFEAECDGKVVSLLFHPDDFQGTLAIMTRALENAKKGIFCKDNECSC